MSAYESHIPVLEYIFARLNPTRILEFGMGYYSTKFFMNRDIELTSVETDYNWADKFRTDCNARHDIHVQPCDEFQVPVDIHLLFVDCNPLDVRRVCVQHGIEADVRIIVAHDTEPESECNYSYNKIILPDGWERVDYMKNTVWTSIFSSDPEVLRVMKEFCS